MAKVQFASSGESYKLPEELYNLVLLSVEKKEGVSAKGPYRGYKFNFSIMDAEPLEEGKGDTMGKKLNVVFWANNDEKAQKLFKETGDYSFPPTGKFANACKALAKSKDIDITSGDFDPETDLKGCICKGMVKNDTQDDGTTYSNLDSGSIREASSKTKAAFVEWKEWKKEQKERDEEFKKDDKPAKKTPKKDEDEELPKKKKPVVEDDEFDEKPAKKPVKKDDDEFEEAPPKKPVKKEEDDDKPAKKAPKKDDDDDLFDD